MSTRRHGGTDVHCPACGGVVDDRIPRCRHCRFTGNDSVSMFSKEFFPLAPVLDTAELWTDAEIAKIRQVRSRFRKLFPQIRIFIETTNLPPNTSLPLYGFWRMNTAPLSALENEDSRTWACLLAIDAPSSRASITCGYRLERWVEDASWQAILQKSAKLWHSKGSAAFVLDFYKNAEKSLRDAWDRKIFRST